MKKMKKRNGFTLFEMLVVISIIAIMTATISLSFSSAQKKARDARRMEDIKSIATAAEQMYSLSGYTYPSAIGAGSTWSVVSGQTVLIFPRGPKTGETYYYSPQPINGVVNATYCACSIVENRANANAAVNCGNFGGDLTLVADNQLRYCAMNQQ